MSETTRAFRKTRVGTVISDKIFIKDHMIDLLQILVAENNVLLRPAPVYIRR